MLIRYVGIAFNADDNSQQTIHLDDVAASILGHIPNVA
jgi:hypothetical protein